MGIVFLAAVLALTATGGTPSTAREFVEAVPLIGDLLSRRVSPTAAKAPPEPADMELVERLIDEGFLSDHPCDWCAVLPEDD